MSAPVALIIGIAGQDGSYLAELLRAGNYRVVGAVRNVQAARKTLDTMRLREVELVAWDMLDQPSMEKTLSIVHPDEVYNFAAYSSGARMFESPVDVGDVNGLSVVRLLEALRAVNPAIRLCQASSSEMFGDALESPQSEMTPFQPRTPYGAAKLYAHSMIRIYRQRYGLFACSAILFNHESPRRGLEFVTRKITHGAARIRLGLANELHLGNLDARRDWGFAGDYVRAMWLMLQQPSAGDYVVATGETHSVRDLCVQAFGHFGLDYREYVHEGGGMYRPPEAMQLVGNPEKARCGLNWVPEVGFEELVSLMVDADMQALA